MSETKHTPGEWTVETVRTSVGHAHRIQPISACIYVDHRAIGDIDDKTMKAAANARLIAAAPDLLAACQAISAVFDGVEDPIVLDASYFVDNANDIFEAAIKARAAIAKAEVRT